MAAGLQSPAAVNPKWWSLTQIRASRLFDATLANGVNIGHTITSPDGQYAYFTWMVYRTNPITVRNIQRGWVLASRIGRVRLDEPAYREAISLDVPRKAVGDPHGLVISNDGQHLVASASGTHELLVYRLPDLPMVGTGGPGDLIDRRLENDRSRFHRIQLGGRPMGLAMSQDNQTVYVANFLRNSVQVVDVVGGELIDEIPLGGSTKPRTLVRQGMALFYDARLSLDQWYSCHSCHQDGGSNSRPMDTLNDGTEMTFKTVLPLFGVHETGPWTWHGWQESLTDSIHKSITSTMIGEAPSKSETSALLAYLKSLRAPPNPYRGADNALSVSAARGKAVFESSAAGCTDCHHGPHLTDGLVHDVGLGSDTGSLSRFQHAIVDRTPPESPLAPSRPRENASATGHRSSFATEGERRREAIRTRSRGPDRIPQVTVGTVPQIDAGGPKGASHDWGLIPLFRRRPKKGPCLAWC